MKAKLSKKTRPKRFLQSCAERTKLFLSQVL